MVDCCMNCSLLDQINLCASEAVASSALSTALSCLEEMLHSLALPPCSHLTQITEVFGRVIGKLYRLQRTCIRYIMLRIVGDIHHF